MRKFDHGCRHEGRGRKGGERERTKGFAHPSMDARRELENGNYLFPQLSVPVCILAVRRILEFRSVSLSN